MMVAIEIPDKVTLKRVARFLRSPIAVSGDVTPGDLLKTAHWLNGVADGKIDINPNYDEKR